MLTWIFADIPDFPFCVSDHRLRKRDRIQA
jgi:hypothetical protein